MKIKKGMKFKIEMNVELNANDCLCARSAISNIMPNAEITYIAKLIDAPVLKGDGE